MENQTKKSTLTLANNISRFRTGLMLAGVVIAIVVSPFLVHETGVETGSMLPSAAATIKQVIGQTTSPGVESVVSGVVGLFK
jgi:hypothetical protein